MHVLFFSIVLIHLISSIDASPPYFGWRPNPSGWKPIRDDSSNSGSWMLRNQNALIRERGRSPFGGRQIYYIIEPKEEIINENENEPKLVEEVIEQIPVVVDSDLSGDSNQADEK